MAVDIFVGNLNFETTEEQLKKHLEQYGPVEACSIKLDKFTFKSKGFARVRVPDEKAAETIINRAGGIVLDGRPLKVEFYS